MRHELSSFFRVDVCLVLIGAPDLPRIAPETVHLIL